MLKERIALAEIEYVFKDEDPRDYRETLLKFQVYSGIRRN